MPLTVEATPNIEVLTLMNFNGEGLCVRFSFLEKTVDDGSHIIFWFGKTFAQQRNKHPLPMSLLRKGKECRERSKRNQLIDRSGGILGVVGRRGCSDGGRAINGDLPHVPWRKTKKRTVVDVFDEIEQRSAKNAKSKITASSKRVRASSKRVRTSSKPAPAAIRAPKKSRTSDTHTVASKPRGTRPFRSSKPNRRTRTDESQDVVADLTLSEPDKAATVAAETSSTTNDRKPAAFVAPEKSTASDAVASKTPRSTAITVASAAVIARASAVAYDSDEEPPEEDPSSSLQWRGDAKGNMSDWTIEIVVSNGLDTKPVVTTYHVHKVQLCYGKRKSDYFLSLFEKRWPIQRIQRLRQSHRARRARC